MTSKKMLRDSLDNTIAMLGALGHMESELKAMRRSLDKKCKNQMASTVRAVGALSTCLEVQQSMLESQLRRASRDR
jgi:hypothetical protein